MQTIRLNNRFLFIGTIRELRFYLRTLPKELTLQTFIQQHIH